MHAVKKKRSDEGHFLCSALASDPMEGVSSDSVSDLAAQRSLALNGMVNLNVGGITYVTTYRTLVSHEGSRLAVYIRQLFSHLSQSGSQSGPSSDEFVNLTGQVSKSYPTVFIDRDGSRFAYVLDYLRDGEVALPEDVTLCRGLLQDARYFGLSALEQTIKLLLDVSQRGTRTPRSGQVLDPCPQGFTNMTVDCAMPTHAPASDHAKPTSPTPSNAMTMTNRVGSICGVGAMVNPFEDSQSFMCSQRSYEEDILGSQKSLLQMLENDNIEDSGVFVQTTPVSRLGKAEFSTTVDF